MRTTRALAIAAAFGLGMSCSASANVVYDSETTNDWFKANVATTSELTSPPWTKPSKGGDAVVKGASNAHYIALDTDLDDPLTYAASGASADIAVVAAEMTATVNATPPQITAAPQAALAVIGDATAAKWTGLVGNGNGMEWVTFQNLAPVIGNSYSVRIEFDQRETRRRIRYLVNGVILLGAGSTDGWYPNPQALAAMNISNVSFSGSGDIKALAGENITENTIAFDTPTQTDGYDYTNGTISVSADIQGYENVTATLTVTGGTDDEKVTVVSQTPGSADWSWGLNGLTQGGIYSYMIEAKDAGGNVIATKTGTFTAAEWSANVWFGADASKSTPTERVKGGAWADAEPTVENATYVIDDGAVFNVTDQEPGSNHVTRVDTVVTFETLVDSNTLEPETDALGGFVAAKSGETPQWMSLTKKDGTLKWIALTGDIAPEVNEQYLIRAEVDSLSESKCVRYFVSGDNGLNFVPLASGGTPWIAFADADKGSLAKVELKGSGKVAKFEATVADKALAKVGNTEYDTMEEAFEAAGTNGENVITLLTNATVDPKKPGSYDIAPGGHHYASGGQISTDTTTKKTIVIDDSGEPKVRPSTEEMNKVKTPDGAQYKNINSLRTFLEKNGVKAYTENGDATAIDNALNDTGANKLPLWEDYVMGIEPKDSVDPVTTPAGDADANNITLAIPAIDTSRYSGDYRIGYQVMKGAESVGEPLEDPGAILIPLTGNCTGTYTIKAVFTPMPALEQAK